MSASSLVSAPRAMTGWQYGSCQSAGKCPTVPWSANKQAPVPSRLTGHESSSRIRNELAGERDRPCEARRLYHAQSDQVGVAVVMNRDGLVGCRRGALELGIGDPRGF